MPASTSIAAAAFQAERHQVSPGSMMAHLWETVRDSWQSARDRAVARAVGELGHDGVIEDYRMARRGNTR
jgi:hypothetical protein